MKQKIEWKTFSKDFKKLLQYSPTICILMKCTMYDFVQSIEDLMKETSPTQFCQTQSRTYIEFRDLWTVFGYLGSCVDLGEIIGNVSTNSLVLYFDVFLSTLNFFLIQKLSLKLAQMNIKEKKGRADKLEFKWSPNKIQ